MKKIILFLITLSIFSFIGIKETYAETKFYEGDYIPNIWLNKKNPNNGLIYYNQARFIKQVGTNKISYCLEPFVYFNGTGFPTGTTTPTNLTNNQIQSMILIAHFGYGYQNHTDPKWYAVTQMMIWKIANPYASYFYTSTKNGSKITFIEETNEIQSLVDTFQKNTSLNKKAYTIVTNTKFSMADINNVLHDYTTTDPKIKIMDNYLETEILTTGTYNITLEKNSLLYNQPILFYQSPTNQDIIEIGDPPTRTNTFTINVVETEVNIIKIDKDNKTTTPQGNATLAGTTISLYTKDKIFIKDIQIDASGKAILKNLDFGSYYLKEKNSGIGYKLNINKYPFTLDENHTNIEIKIPNEVIKGKLKIIKEYGYQNNFKPEANISFNIYDQKQNLIQTITTNKEGIAEITLPYGTYTLTQLTTTEGYQKVEPIEFEIKEDNELIEHHLKNYKIEVPNTKTSSILDKIIQFLKDLLCVKK